MWKSTSELSHWADGVSAWVLISTGKLLIIAVARGGVALTVGEKTFVAFNAASAAAHARSSSSERGSLVA